MPYIQNHNQQNQMSGSHIPGSQEFFPLKATLTLTAGLFTHLGSLGFSEPCSVQSEQLAL